MNTDERAIRDIVAEWFEATAAGDLERLLPLMADDVVFGLARSQTAAGYSRETPTCCRPLASGPHFGESLGGG